MIETVKNISEFKQAQISTDIETAVLSETNDVVKTTGDQILQLIESSSIDPNLGKNVDLVA